MAFTPTATIAKDNTRPAPLHIKINGSKTNASKKQFSITVGKAPKKNKDEKHALNFLNNMEKSLKKNAPQPTIKKHSCEKISTSGSNRYKKLADSLKNYLKSKNRPSSLIDDIYKASTTTHTDFELLIITAMIESDLGRVTESKTSSARGIFQYIDPTWISLVKRYGQKIGQYDNGVISNLAKSDTKRIDTLALRHNTRIASLIKAYQLQNESKILSIYKNGQRINTTDYYIMHMLGSSQARIFYKLLNEKSDNKLADSGGEHFQEAVRLNPTFFYGNNNNSLNATQAYNQFHRKVSQQYKRLHDINEKYGDGNILRSKCKLPNVQTVSAIKTTKDHRL